MADDNYKPSPSTLQAAQSESNLPLQYDPDLLQHESFGGFWIRVLAHILDSLILFVPTTAAEVALNQLGSMHPLAIRLVAFAIVWTPYQLVFWQGAWRATPGKRICGLAIMNANGTAMSGADAITRYLCYLFSSTLVIGTLFIAATQRRQALHDLMAKTVVVKRSSLMAAASI